MTRQQNVITDTLVSNLRPSAHNARIHSRKQIRQIAESIKRFGFTNPILASETSEVLAGHGRLAAAKLLRLNSVPVIFLSDLSETERRAYLLADNKLALDAAWDQVILTDELTSLIAEGFDVTVSGFDPGSPDWSDAAPKPRRSKGRTRPTTRSKGDRARNDPATCDLAKCDLDRSDLAKSDLARSDLAKSDLTKGDPPDNTSATADRVVEVSSPVSQAAAARDPVPDPAAPPHDGQSGPASLNVHFLPLREATRTAPEVWVLGRHRLICGAPHLPETYERLLRQTMVDLLVTDCHRAIDERAEDPDLGRRRPSLVGGSAYNRFDDVLKHGASWCQRDAVAALCLRWHQMADVVAAASRGFARQIGLSHWIRSVDPGDMGHAEDASGRGDTRTSEPALIALYHPAVACALEEDRDPVSRLAYRRVWDTSITRVNDFGDDWTQHEGHARPTPETDVGMSVAFTCDLLTDIGADARTVLDPFGGNGATLMAAEHLGLTAFVIERDPGRCAAIIQRFEAHTGHYASRDAA